MSSPAATPNPAPNASSNQDVVAGVHRLLNTQEASIYLDCHERTIFKLVKQNRLQGYRLGRYLKFHLADLNRALVSANASDLDDSLDDFVQQQTKSTEETP